MVAPQPVALPPVYIDISNVLDDVNETSFDLVVRTPLRTPVYTYGGGRVTVLKPYNDTQLDAALNNAVNSIIRNGNLPDRSVPPGASPLSNPPRALMLACDAHNRASR